ncbi:MAG: hypothetical protein KGI91_16555, partial [Burkholderiales bacterium]|nr:hypothetical protein [Burkholderiales bacterium]
MILYNRRFITLVGSLAMVSLCVPVGVFAGWVAITTFRDAPLALQIPVWLLFLTMVTLAVWALVRIYFIPKRIPPDETLPKDLDAIVPPKLKRKELVFLYLLAPALILYTTYGLAHGQIVAPAKREAVRFTGLSLFPIAICYYSLAARIVNELIHQRSQNRASLIKYRNVKAMARWLTYGSFAVSIVVFIFQPIEHKPTKKDGVPLQHHRAFAPQPN